MGAKQSKRSVDISGKEAEGAGEVAAAGAGGEGRVEQLADVDALKPQLNGDAHITPPDEQTEKEKQLDSGTPENEKDATTEKEEKKQENGTEKEDTPVTNGESEQKESAESAPSEDSKKPKKEKVKKKWSLRSISFSRKDKPKQEKKQKEEEANKTNGEPEKVPEEAIEATPEADEKVIEEVKPEVETKDEKTPETPVTEPITNGSSTPESPKVESPITEAEHAVASTEKERPEAEAVVEPEQLPVNGLSLEEPKKETSNATHIEERKLEESTTETTVLAPVPEIPVKTEVCVQQMPLIESTPPPLPANPPPSSVASFAATTMAPELTNALLANTTETAVPLPPAIPDTNADNLNEISDNNQIKLKTEVTSNENIDDIKETAEEMSISIEKKTDSDNNDVIDVPVAVEQPNFNQESINIETDSPVKDDVVEVVDQISPKQDLEEANEAVTTNSNSSNVPIYDENETIVDNKAQTPVPSEFTTNTAESIDAVVEKYNEVSLDENAPKVFKTDVQESVDMKLESPESVEDIPLPPPPADDDQDMDQGSDIQETNHIIDSNHTNELEKTDIPNDVDDKLIETEETAMKIITKDSIDTVTEKTECNGNLESVELTLEQCTKESPAKVNGTDEDVDIKSCKAKAPELSAESVCIAAGGDAAPPASAPARASPLAPPPAPADEPQDALATSEKLADLIPEIPAVPELNTETLQETTSEMAVPAAGGN